MKKILVVAALLTVVAGFAPHALADSSFVPLAPIPGLTDAQTTSVVNSDSLANFFNNLYRYLIGLAAALAVIEIIRGGLEVSTKDSVSQKTDGKHRIYQALLGLVLVLSPVVVFSIINPSILNLSLNMPELKKMQSTTSTPGGGQTGTTDTKAIKPQLPTIDSNNCIITGTFIETAVCPTKEAAQQFVSACSSSQRSGKIMACKTTNSSGCADTTYKATCDSFKIGPYVFIDTGPAWRPTLFSDYQPLASSNGSAAVIFANTCTQEGGVTCLYIVPSGNTNSDAVTCPSYKTPLSGGTKDCFNMKIACETSGVINYRCGASPKWTPIQ